MKKKYAKDYTLQELMVVVAARELRDREIVFVGIGIPQLAAVLAQRTHAPNLVLIYESGTIAAKPMRMPLSIGDPTLASGTAGIYNFIETFSYLLQRKFIDVGFLGGAQIDKYGNINSTVIGDYEQPKVRLPGSGGGCDIAALAKRVIILTPHEKRRFVEKVDFITSPGYLDHPAAREKLGLTGGPSAVVTTMGVLRFDDATKEMYLDSYHPGVSTEQIKENTGWDLILSPSVKETEPPTEDQVTLLREKIDPEGYYLKKAES
ncbi:CoA-transferase subunit beta [Candidatus Bathyarchaeota archaeon]|nr:CoA-transferase subunit beta [Candidatus Bathyarchaeota archaeon]NIW13972.1 CoA-transferase subunit beta [Candidatus Thorarchaeota archaeon]